jgi:hypothetical protein
MKKLFSTIVVFALLLSGNAYAELLRLSCVSSDNTMSTNVVIDADKNYATVQNYPVSLKVTSDLYIMEYRMLDGPPDINFSIDRNTGIYNEVWFGSKTLYFNGRCSLAKKKF